MAEAVWGELSARRTPTRDLGGEAGLLLTRLGHTEQSSVASRGLRLMFY